MQPLKWSRQASILALCVGSILVGSNLRLARAQAAREVRHLALTSVRLVEAADAPLHTLVVKDGMIEAILPAGTPPPVEARVVDGGGMLALPAFIDAWSTLGVATPTPEPARDVPPDTRADAPAAMRSALRKGLQPAVRAAVLYAPDKKAVGSYREAGFGLVAAAPTGQYLAGRACVVATKDGAPRDLIVVGDAYDCASFEAPGPGYPSTLMGAIAHLRQFLLDATRQRALERRRAQGQPGPRPPFDPDFEAVAELLAGRRRLGFEANGADDIERALSLCAEFGLSPLVLDARGIKDALPRVLEAKAPVVLSLEWSDEVEDPSKPERKAPSADDAPWTYEEPLRVREDARAKWLEKRDVAKLLAERGVLHAYAGKGVEPAKLVERVRTLVEDGLPLAAAQRALTLDAARILGLEAQAGLLAPGRMALVALWSAHPLLDEKAQLRVLVVEDALHEYELKKDEPKKDAKKDAEGKPGKEAARDEQGKLEGVEAFVGGWDLARESDGASMGVLEVSAKGDAGALEGVLRFAAKEPLEQATLVGAAKEGKLALAAKLEVAGAPVEIVVEATRGADGLRGEFKWVAASGARTEAFVAKAPPRRRAAGSAADGSAQDGTAREEVR
jgi:imidazolonepropionase-like amidohydrolase